MSTARRLLRAVRYSPPLLRASDAVYFAKASRRGSFSQFEEDRALVKLLGPRPGTYFDIGANHPFKGSNSYLLYRNRWRGVTVDPLPGLVRLHNILRRNDRSVCCAIGTTPGQLTLYETRPTGFSTLDRAHAMTMRAERGILVTERTVDIRRADDIWREFTSAPPDFVSIDTEGAEFDVLSSMDWEHQRPRILAIETGRSDGSCHEDELLRFTSDAGYEPLDRFGVNLILRDAS